MGRRGALQGAAGAATLGATAPHMLVEALRAAPATDAAAPVAGVAARAAVPITASVIASLKGIPALMSGMRTKPKLDNETKAFLDNVFKGDANKLKNYDKWMVDWAEPKYPNEWVKGFDFDKASEAFKKEALEAGADEMQIWKNNYVTSGDEKFDDTIRAIKAKHFPDSAISPEYIKFNDALNEAFLIPDDELMKWMSTMPPGSVKPEWAAKGITADMLRFASMPTSGPGGSSPNYKLFDMFEPE